MIAEIAKLHAVDSAVNCNLCFCVAKLAVPFQEDVFLAARNLVQNLVHKSGIVYKRIFVSGNPYLIDPEPDSKVSI
jgi:hypothetical protein